MQHADETSPHAGQYSVGADTRYGPGRAQPEWSSLVGRRDMLRISDLLLIGAAAAFWPLAVMGANTVGMTHPERLLALAMLVCLVAIGLTRVLTGLGMRRTVAVPGVFLAVVLCMIGGRVLEWFGEPAGWLILVGLIGAWFGLLVRLRDSALVSSLTIGLAVALLSGSAISLTSSYLNWGSSNVRASVAPAIQLEETPDIFLVVVDGYPGLRTLATESGDGKDDLLVALAAQGFHTPSSAWGSYWSTALSIPSILEMSYPVVEDFDGQATTQELYDIISGETELIGLLNDHGYVTYMVESGWSGSACGSSYDRCVAAPILDEAMYITLSDTLLGARVDRLAGHPFTVGTEQTMKWLAANAPAMSRDDTASFVFAHLVAPHPPFYLDEDCQRTISSDRDGSGLYKPGVPNEDRERFFNEQMTCVDRFMLNLAAGIDRDSVVVFISDHGTARDRQLNIPADRWDRSNIAERFNVLASVRLRQDCEVADPLILPNLMREVLSCYSDSRIERLEPRMFMPAMVEVDKTTVDALLANTGSER